MQVSFSHDGIFISGSSSCPGEAGEPRISLAALYVLPKAAVYSLPPDTNTPATIKAAIYVVRNSWYRSVTKNELSLTPDSFEPFNSIPCPARPQTIEDMKSSPMFVLKVRANAVLDPQTHDLVALQASSSQRSIQRRTVLAVEQVPAQHCAPRFCVPACKHGCLGLQRWLLTAGCCVLLLHLPLLLCVCMLQVDNAHLSIATLTDDCPLGKMNSIDSAPRIKAVVVGKGADYAAAEGFSDGKQIMPQVRACNFIIVRVDPGVVSFLRVLVWEPDYICDLGVHLGVLPYGSWAHDLHQCKLLCCVVPASVAAPFCSTTGNSGCRQSRHNRRGVTHEDKTA